MLYRLVRWAFVSMLAKRSGYSRQLVGDEIDSIYGTLSHRRIEAEIIEVRLMRRFDPAMAWSEAINRACAAKKIARESIFSGGQKAAFEVQQETTHDILRRA